MFALQDITTTITTNVSQAQHVVLQLRSYSTIEKLQKLLEEMKNSCEGFTAPKGEKTKELISAWEAKFFAEYKLDSLESSSRMRTVYALAFFYFQRVEFVIKHVTDAPKDKVQWFNFYCQLKEIISEALPADLQVNNQALPREKPIDTFLRVYKMREAEKPFMQEMIKAIHLFQALENRLFEHANQINQLLVERFEVLKLELLNLWQESENNTEALYARLDQLTTKVKEVFEEFGIAMQALDGIENQMIMQEQTRLQQINTTESLIDTM